MEPAFAPKPARRKRLEDPVRRLRELAAANAKLEREVGRRRAAESALRKNEEHQRQMREKSEQMQVQMRDLSRRLLTAQEEERRRISRELHDDVLQTLVGINVHLENLARDAQIDLARLRENIVRTQRLVTDSVGAIHRFARELRPLILDDLGLLPALQSCLADFQKRTGIRVQFAAAPETEQLSGARRIVVYRVVQSALANIVQHADARRVKVSVKADGETLLLEVRDNGRSFDVEKTLDARRYKRMGLLGMRERIEMVGGRFSIESAVGKGTAVQAEFPRGNDRVKLRRSPRTKAGPAPA